MIELYNRCKFDVDLSLINKIKDEYSDKHVELIISGSKYIKKINRQHRNIDKPTDVLSFPLIGEYNISIGSIIICLDIAKKASKLYKHNINDEIVLLFVHGLLHLLGYDHDIDIGEMRDKEKQIIDKYNLPKSLIIRTNGQYL
jgi:probable rRNA maturation factor